MSTSDYIYRFDSDRSSLQPPRDAAAARKRLEDGNRLFAKWMESCRTTDSCRREPRYVIECAGVEVGLGGAQQPLPRQVPFAVAVGCSDARVPIEMVFGQGFNDLFVVRVAGNVLGDVCAGSIDFALNDLSESVKCIVVVGHGGCGAVTGAVDCYLEPAKFRDKSMPHNLRSIIQRIFVSVREAASGLKECWGPDARSIPGYREALIDIGVGLNAAQAAFDLRQEVERAAKREIQVLYGVFSLHTHQVSMPVDPRAPIAPESVNLAHAPTDPSEFHALAVAMARLLKPGSAPRPAAQRAQRRSSDTSIGSGRSGQATDYGLVLEPDHLGRDDSV
jgi:carbonic anhydrase